MFKVRKLIAFYFNIIFLILIFSFPAAAGISAGPASPKEITVVSDDNSLLIFFAMRLVTSRVSWLMNGASGEKKRELKLIFAEWTGIRPKKQLPKEKLR